MDLSEEPDVAQWAQYLKAATDRVKFRGSVALGDFSSGSRIMARGNRRQEDPDEPNSLEPALAYGKVGLFYFPAGMR
jgi:hypothetical protein